MLRLAVLVFLGVNLWVQMGFDFMWGFLLCFFFLIWESHGCYIGKSVCSCFIQIGLVSIQKGEEKAIEGDLISPLLLPPQDHLRELSASVLLKRHETFSLQFKKLNNWSDINLKRWHTRLLELVLSDHNFFLDTISVLHQEQNGMGSHIIPFFSEGFGILLCHSLRFHKQEYGKNT